MNDAIVKLGVMFLGSKNVKKEIKYSYIFWLSRDIHFFDAYVRLKNHLLGQGRMVDKLKSDLILNGAKHMSSSTPHRTS